MGVRRIGRARSNFAAALSVRYTLCIAWPPAIATLVALSLAPTASGCLHLPFARAVGPAHWSKRKCIMPTETPAPNSRYGLQLAELRAELVKARDKAKLLVPACERRLMMAHRPSTFSCTTARNWCVMNRLASCEHLPMRNANN